VALLYDPPAGWQYGFPKPYNPLPGEKLRDTLVRDGYPNEESALEIAVAHCRFIGPKEELDTLVDLE